MCAGPGAAVAWLVHGVPKGPPPPSAAAAERDPEHAALGTLSCGRVPVKRKPALRSSPSWRRNRRPPSSRLASGGGGKMLWQRSGSGPPGRTTGETANMGFRVRLRGLPHAGTVPSVGGEAREPSRPGHGLNYRLRLLSRDPCGDYRRSGWRPCTSRSAAISSRRSSAIVVISPRRRHRHSPSPSGSMGEGHDGLRPCRYLRRGRMDHALASGRTKGSMLSAKSWVQVSGGTAVEGE